MKKLFVALGLALAACGGSSEDKKTVTVKGSDTMVILGQRWAEHYMQKHPGSLVQITGGGSGTGIAALINGATDVCQSSRPMKEKERNQIRAKFGKDVVEIPVAMDGLAVFVNEANPLREIGLAQLKAVYTGKVADWKNLGREAGTIVSYGRENNSGTYMYFKEHVLNEEDFASGVQTLPGTAAVINAVSKDRLAIGYGGIGYTKGVKTLKVKKDESSPAVEPTLENVVSGSYPISRYLYFYTVGLPEGPSREFIRWVLGEEGQQVCEKVGYYPLPLDKRMKFEPTGATGQGRWNELASDRR